MLEVDNVSVNYGAVRAVHSVSLSVNEGEIVTLLGPNGAGKTSMLSAIIGLVPVAEGTVSFEGHNINRLDTESRVARGITVTPEGRHVFANLTVEENLILGAAIRRDADGVARDLRDLPRHVSHPARALQAERRLAFRRRAADAGGGPGADVGGRSS